MDTKAQSDVDGLPTGEALPQEQTQGQVEEPQVQKRQRVPVVMNRMEQAGHRLALRKEILAFAAILGRPPWQIYDDYVSQCQARGEVPEDFPEFDVPRGAVAIAGTGGTVVIGNNTLNFDSWKWKPEDGKIVDPFDKEFPLPTEAEIKASGTWDAPTLEQHKKQQSPGSQSVDRIKKNIHKQMFRASLGLIPQQGSKTPLRKGKRK